jgi:hypothetical protein
VDQYARAHVAILRADGTEPVVSGKDGLFFVDEERDGKPTEGTAQMWLDTTLNFVALSADKEAARGSVYLWPPTRQEMVFQKDYLARLVERARQHAWGAEIYLLVESDPRCWPPDPSDELLTACRQWLDTARTAGVTDIIEIPPVPPVPEALDLSKARMRSSTRQEKLHRMARASRWRFHLAGKKKGSLLCFVRGYEYVRNRDGDEVSLLIGIDKGSIQRQLVAEAIQQYLSLPCAVALIGKRATRPLDMLCREPNKIDLIYCHDRFELRYALMLLNAASNKDEDAVKEGLLDGPVVDPDCDKKRPLLLLTASFSPTPASEAERCIQAARDMDEVLHGAPGRPDHLVHPRLTTTALVNMVRRSPERILAWVHMAHGAGPAGLKEFDGANAVSPDRWVKCFAGCGQHKIPLVFLSACDSAETAECFAQQQRARVAIGFRGKTSARTCQLLVRPVVHAALKSGGDVQAIREAFRMGREEVTGCDKDVQPVVYPTR